MWQKDELFNRKLRVGYLERLYTNWKWANIVVNSYIDNLWKIPIIQNIPMLPET